ncbi:MAG: methyl-accepting chemotaxis protein [Rhodocyclaceae bacterium]
MLSRLTIAQRVASGFAILIILLVAVGGVGIFGMTRQYRQVSELLDRDISTYRALLTAQLRVSKLRRDEKDVFLSVGDTKLIDEYLGKWNKSLQAVGSSAEEVRKLSSADDRRALEDIEKVMAAYSAGMQDAVAKIKNGTYASSLQVNDAFEPSKKQAQNLIGGFDKLAKQSDARIKAIDGALGAIRASITGLTAGIVAAALALGCFGAWLIIRSIRRPLRAMQDTVQHIERSGRIGMRMPTEGTDEIARTSQAVNHLLEGMCIVIGDAGQNSAQLVEAAQTLNDAAMRVTEASHQQAEAAGATAAAIDELTTSIAHVADRARAVEDETHHAAQTAADSVDAARNTADHIREVATSIQRSAELVNSLNRRSDEIGSIVMVIKEIADQTNLLALNAAIEAARAGEQGRGFAVVADEVRKLAERTTAATLDITGKIDGVQKDTSTAAADMHAASEEIGKGVASTEHVAEALHRIEQLSRNTAQHTADIAMAIKEQSAASQDITRHIERIASTSAENNAAAGETHDLSTALGGIAERLDGTIKRFSL